jgi:hypothetical protein
MVLAWLAAIVGAALGQAANPGGTQGEIRIETRSESQSESQAESNAPAAPGPAPGSEAVWRPDLRDSVCLMIEAAARAHDLPLEFFGRVIWQESRFHADAVGPRTRSGGSG